MQLVELMEMLNFMVDEEYELEPDGSLPAVITRLFNACSADLTEIARYPLRATYPYDKATDGSEINLPADTFKLIQKGGVWFGDTVLAEVPLTDTTSTSGYSKWGTVLILKGPPADAGTIKLYYFGKLPKFTGVSTEEPVIPEAYHELYALFAAMRYMQNLQDKDEIALKRDFQAEYQQKKAEFEAYMLENTPAPFSVTQDVLPTVS
jgi:hypothetical protein